MACTHLSGLLEWLLVYCDKDDGVWAKTVFGSSLHILDDVLALGEVDECVGAELLQAHLPLLITTVDGNSPQAHSAGVLLCERTETTTGTYNGDSLTWLGSRLLQSLVDGNTGAQHGRDRGKVTFLGNASCVCCLGNAVLLEGAIDGVARQEGLAAQRFVRGLAEVARQARSVNPLDTSIVATV